MIFLSKWKECIIADLGEVVGGATPSTKKTENYENGDISWITPKDLSTFNGRFINRGERSITKIGLNSCSTRLLPPNSVLFSSRAPIGYVAIAAKEMCTNQGFKSVIPNSDTDYMFLYYLLKFNKDNIENMGSGTTFKEVSGNTMKSIKVYVPVDIEEQRKIASILSALDDKIELNNRINKNLESQAQAIFKSWFVDFEPFGGVMPEDWKVGNLLDIADYLNGLAMQKFRPNENENSLPVLKIKELRQGFCDNTSDLCSENIKSEYIIHDGDVIFSWSGSLLVDFWCGGTCGLNQHLFKVTSEKYNKWFYYLWTQYHLQKFISIAKDMATTMGHIKREELKKSEVLIPNSEDYSKIGNLLSPIYDMIIANRLENKRLAKLRDTLLPKLMNGEIDVSEVKI